MLTVGLTGGIASGKSTVSSKLKDYGALIIDADQIAREVVKKNGSAWREIRDYFGVEVLLPSGEINRKVLGRIVFNNEEARQFLNEVTHPEILRRSENLIELYKKQDKDLVILDAPLLIESGAYTMVEKVWVVYCSKPIQIKRLMTRDGISWGDAVKRIETQMPLDEKLHYADEVINSEGDLEETEAQIKELWRRYLGGRIKS